MSEEEKALPEAGEPPVPGWPAESAQRLEKARALAALGVAVYPTRFERTHRLGEIGAAYGDKTLEELEGLSSVMIDWLTPEGESSIGTILYHLVDIEADWLYVDVLEGSLPPAVAELFPFPTRYAQFQLTQVQGFSLDEHLGRLEIVRGLLLGVFQAMDLAEFRRVHSLPD